MSYMEFKKKWELYRHVATRFRHFACLWKLLAPQSCDELLKNSTKGAKLIMTFAQDLFRNNAVASCSDSTAWSSRRPGWFRSFLKLVPRRVILDYSHVVYSLDDLSWQVYFMKRLLLFSKETTALMKPKLPYHSNASAQLNLLLNS